MIDTFTPDVLRMLRAEMTDALTAFADKHGLTVKIGTMKFEAERFSCPLEITKPGVTKEMLMLKSCVALIGLKPEDIGATFTASGVTYRLVGYNARKRQKPMVVENLANGKTYFTTEAAVKRALGRDA